jgi:hypothetical protein
MILLLGASGNTGNAYMRYFKRKGISFRTPSRSEVDYKNLTKSTALLVPRSPSFCSTLLVSQENPIVDACAIHKAECLAGNAVLPGMPVAFPTRLSVTQLSA